MVESVGVACCRVTARRSRFDACLTDGQTCNACLSGTIAAAHSLQVKEENCRWARIYPYQIVHRSGENAWNGGVVYDNVL